VKRSHIKTWVHHPDTGGPDGLQSASKSRTIGFTESCRSFVDASAIEFLFLRVSWTGS
jgi:hypothetical protein